SDDSRAAGNAGSLEFASLHEREAWDLGPEHERPLRQASTIDAARPRRVARDGKTVWRRPCEMAFRCGKVGWAFEDASCSVAMAPKRRAGVFSAQRERALCRPRRAES